MTVQTILCVDDDPTILRLVARCLRREDLEIRTTESPADALAWIANDDIAVLVSDYDMPQMTGAELAYQARRLRPEVVRILLTAQQSLETAVDGINRGEIFRFVSKPFEPKVLRDAVDAALERHRELLELSGERARNERRRAMRGALEQEYPGISTIAREGGRYEVRDPQVLAAELGMPVLVGMLEEP